MSPAVLLEARLAERERPAGNPAMFQRWEDLLFLHWRWDAAEIQRSLPDGLTVDTFDGAAWVGVVPFFMSGIRPRLLPAVPWLSNFLELNVRTYAIDARGRPGVWFYSLDCNRSIPVWLARRFFYLPYQHASMRAARRDGMVNYSSRRRGSRGESRFIYGASGAADESRPGTLEFFLIERYRLFAAAGAAIRSGRVHHRPYQLAAATVEQWSTDLFALDGLPSPAFPPDHTAFSAGVSVDVYALDT